MEQIYAFGVACIEVIQYWLADYDGFFELVNKVFDPEHMIDILFPLMTIIDSVFAAQLLLCLAFGGWLNAVMKWWFLEDRPYWWVRETTFYPSSSRPVLRQTLQTCETGPGSPSGHTSTAAMILILVLMWLSHVMYDRKQWCFWWWKSVMYPFCGLALISVILARIFIATHFPHQCLIGALVGAFVAPALCIYISDPFIWRYGIHATYETRRAVAWHILGAVTTIIVAGLTYLSLLWCGLDPQWTVKLAFRWCENPESIRVSTTPLYALVHATGSLLGWALCVTPAVAEYRHYTKNRSLVISAFTTITMLVGFQHIQDNICKSDAMKFYASLFVLSAIKPMLLLRVTPATAMWPFQGSKTKKD
ncbi:glucose-6-phosphatase 2 [Spodoptera litura]|uniref:glucose-6-phosphatase n=1 Tax=Spodoptera litura TaxID=69820 RepID=A0A9J7DWK0_SPOLT|nr:glucose-6-phosphatase 2 [Spodoptera litura]